MKKTYRLGHCLKMTEFSLTSFVGCNQKEAPESIIITIQSAIC